MIQLYGIKIYIYREYVLKIHLSALCYHKDNSYTKDIGLKYILT